MAIETGISEHFLFPCMLFGSTTPHRVQTILGSCISVCLFDQVLNHGAINHFMLPWWNGQDMPSPKYGDVATNRLLEKMMSMGSRRENIVAKIFGGADQHSLAKPGYGIGAKNIAITEQILARESIKIVAQSTGGQQGRKIVFFSHSSQVLVKYLPLNNVEL
jgi:chemotaxis protein CheD